jgi:hypothetical protein
VAKGRHIILPPLHSTALHCTPLHSTALHCTPLHSTALHCTPLHSTALHAPPDLAAPHVLEGLAALYASAIAATPAARGRFLSALLKPFGAACNLVDLAASSREDAQRLAFCAHVAAALPLRRGDEPLTLVHGINAAVSRQAQEALNCLRGALRAAGLSGHAALEADNDEDDNAPPADAQGSGAPAPEQQQQQHRHQPELQQQPEQQQPSLPLPLPLPTALAGPLKACLALSMLLVLKQYLSAAYGLSDERVAAFELKGERCRTEAKTPVAKDRRVPPFALDVVCMRAERDATGALLVDACTTFASLLDSDAANYRCASSSAASQCDRRGGRGVWAAAVRMCTCVCVQQHYNKLLELLAGHACTCMPVVRLVVLLLWASMLLGRGVDWDVQVAVFGTQAE